MIDAESPLGPPACTPTEMLAPESVYLWFAFADEIVDPVLFRRYGDAMSVEERVAASRYTTEIERRRYVVSRALVRSVLSRHHPEVPCRSWRLRAELRGRPEIAAPEIQPRLRFSLSRSNGVVVCATCVEKDVGVDIAHSPTTIEVSRHFLSPSEREDLSRLNPREAHAHFCDLWTLKEAYLKATGVGFTVEPAELTIAIDACRRIHLRHAPLQDDGSIWQLLSLDLDAEHRVGVAVRDESPTSLRVDARAIVPLGPERPVFPVLRASTTPRGMRARSA